jgi:hypothetical protein
MREAFPPCLPITNSSGIENNNNNHKECNYNHTSQTNSNNNNCHKGKDINIDRNNEITKDIPINDTEKICFDSDEGESNVMGNMCD